MRVHNSPLIIVVTLLIANATFGYGNSKASNETLETQEALKIELLPRKLNSWEDPSLSGRYKKGDKLFFRVRVTNTSIVPVDVLILDQYFQIRPEVFGDGQLVAYRKLTSDLIESKEREPSERHRALVSLQPNDSRELVFLNLADWYGLLEPGTYQLSVKFRFSTGETQTWTWIESSPISFQVVPSKQLPKDTKPSN